MELVYGKVSPSKSEPIFRGIGIWQGKPVLY